jgi:hypothetical protein
MRPVAKAAELLQVFGGDPSLIELLGYIPRAGAEKND